MTAKSPTLQWPLRARIWLRTLGDGRHEKVLEMEGVIDDIALTSRHTQPDTVPDADIPGLPHLYDRIKVLDDALEAIQTEAERENGGLVDLKRVIRNAARTARSVTPS